MNKRSLQDLVDEIRAAGEPTRTRVLALLQEGELSVGELTQILVQSQPRLSRHMKFLTAAGLVERLPEGAWVFYRLPSSGPSRRLVDAMLAALDPDDETIASDRVRLLEVREARQREAASYFERSAMDWDGIRALHYPEKEIEKAILRLAGDGPFERIVDMGTGTGRMLALFAPIATSLEGIDLSHQMLTIARSNLASKETEHANVRHGDATRTPFEAQSADLVIIHQVLHFLDEPVRAVQEAARILRPNGRLIVVDFAPHDLENFRREQAHRHLGFERSSFVEWSATCGIEVGHCETFAPPSHIEQGLAVNIFTAQKKSEPAISGLKEKA